VLNDADPVVDSAVQSAAAWQLAEQLNHERSARLIGKSDGYTR